jgi:hypothetical protein
MAKKRRRESAEPQETYEFVPPEFDEKEFLLKDLYGTKVLLVVLALAVLTGIIAASIQKMADNLWYLGLLLMFLVMFLFKHILALLQFKVELVDQKTLIGNYIMFFFLSLGTWIILLNPPF